MLGKDADFRVLGRFHELRWLPRRWIVCCCVGLFVCALWQMSWSGPYVYAQEQSRDIPSAPLSSGQQQGRAQAVSPEQANSLLLRARQAAKEGSFPSAEASVLEFLSQQPASAAGHYLLGYILYLEVRPKESLAEYTLAAQQHTPTAVDLEIVALDYVLLRDFADADRWLTKSLAWNAANAQGWYYLGRTKYNENRFTEAIDAFTTCMKLDPRNVKAEDNIGLSYEGLGRSGEAAKAFQTAIHWQEDANQKNAQPFLNLGSLLTDQGHADASLPYLLKATQLAPQNAKAHEQLGRAYLKLKQPKDARGELEKAVQLAPNDSSLHFELGINYRDQGLKDRAKQEFDRCAALNATHSSIETPNE